MRPRLARPSRFRHARAGARDAGLRPLAIALLVFAASVPVACGGEPAPGPNPIVSGGSVDGGALAALDGGQVTDVDVPACVEAPGRDTAATRALEDGAGSASVAVQGAACARTFALTSTASRRDDDPKSPRSVSEAGRTSLSTRSDLFDALYQLALEEAKENSVEAIKDGAFRGGAALPCAAGGCFETGRKWNYVWTRDTSYAVDLGLGFVDPLRARTSLEFKLSTRRDGSDLQIVQDTGTGGSYPVSSDRAVWALGARALLDHLTGDARTAFRDRALEAITNTAEHDRAVVFDPRDGLYRGEQSFLDWRSQSYPGWTVPDLVNIATSKSLSTNVAHVVLLETGADLATEKGDAALAAKLRARANDLRAATRQKLWLPEDAAFSTYVTTDLDQAPARRFDLLGTSLAILHDVATPEQARAALAAYPTLPKGPPVIFPQQKETAIYHNRAIWPFVTAYWVRAARKVGNDVAFDAGVRSLVRGAALYLSNVENLEVVTGKPWVDDGAYSGPVVNSQRQLWSVAGYLAMVHAGLFGIETRPAGLRVAPFVSKALRRTTFSAADALVLNDLRIREKKVSFVVRLPAVTPGDGAYAVARVRLNGVDAPDGVIDEARLRPRNLVEVDLVEPVGPALAPALRTITDITDYRVLYAPRTPAISGVTLAAGKLSVGIDLAGESAADVTVSIYRDGARVAKDLPGTTGSWQDASTTGETSPSHCYTAELRYASGNVSQRARPACFWGSGNARITAIPATSFDVTGGSKTTAYGKTFYEAWGDAGHTLAGTFQATRSGEHLVQAVYGNGAGSLETGVTCAVKKLVVEEVGGPVVATGYLVMPQRADWASWGDSSSVRAPLVSGKTYRVRLEADARAVNMSAFQHFADYTGGTGGSGGAFFRVNVAELKVLALVP